MARHPSSAETIAYEPGDERMGREGTLEHFAHHHITATEIEQVFTNNPMWWRNKKGRRANWRMVGETDGGRLLDIKVFWDEDRGVLIPITGLSLSKAVRRTYRRGSGSR